MANPEIRYAGNAVNDLSNPQAGTRSWSNVENVAKQDGQTTNVSLVSTSEFKDTSRVLLTQLHHFNLPTNAIVSNIEITWYITEQTNTTRYYTALYSGGYGTTNIFNHTGAKTNFSITLSANPSVLGFPSLSLSDIANQFFGAGIVAYDPNSLSPTVRIDSINIKITFTGSNLIYKESNDFFFANSGIEVGGKVFAKPYIIDFPGETEGGILIGGSHFVGGSQTMVGTGGALISPNAEINPYFETISGGAILGGRAKTRYDEIGTGGIVCSGLTPNGTHDFGSGGVFVSGLGDLKVDFVIPEGGAKVGGIVLAKPFIIDLPGENEGGIFVGGRAKTSYDEIGTGGATIPAILGHFFTYPSPEITGGTKIGGSAEVNPYFETTSGGVKVGNITAPVEVIWIGLEPFSLYQGAALFGGETGTTVNVNEYPIGGVVTSGHTAENTTVEDISGGVILNGNSRASVEPKIEGGILVGGNNTNDVEHNFNIIGGGVTISGTYEFNYHTSGNGGITLNGSAETEFGLFYTASGGITTAGLAEIEFGLFYSGTGGITLNSGITGSRVTRNYNTTGGIELNGQSVNKASYDFNVVVGDGIIIGSRSDTGIPLVFRAVKRPKGTIGRSLKSDNIFKSDMESLLITTIPKNPELCGLSTKDIRLNKCKGAFVPPQLVNRQKEHLPTPKQETKNRSSQLAKSG